MAARAVKPLLPLLAVASLAAVDPELAAIARRCYPSDDDEARRAREREEENQRRRIEELRELQRLTRDALEGAFGKGVRDNARAIIAEGRSEVHMQRVRKLVREWRRAGRARKSSKGKAKK